MADEKPPKMKWDGTRAAARAIENWARDAALLPYAQGTPTGDPDKPYVLRLKVDLPDGQGNEWQIVPVGATVLFGGTEDDPKFTIQTPKEKAQAFDHPV